VDIVRHAIAKRRASPALRLWIIAPASGPDEGAQHRNPGHH
jgi:hypothetical protein